MSKILIFADNHFCEKTSIVIKYGTKYRVRLENQIESLNWLEDLAVEQKCDSVICLGDFFDHDYLTDMEATALKDIKWNSLPHAFLVGNHESGYNGLKYNVTKLLEGPNRRVISEASKFDLDDNTELCFLPYIIESDRKLINEYFGNYSNEKKRIILSHNDIAGIQLGPVMSKVGFNIDDITNNCDLFLNGHLHNGRWINKKVLNLGNLTGKDFGEDASLYTHNIAILDTETLKITLIENPYAFNFYKIEINNENEIKKLHELKQNSAITIKCNHSMFNLIEDEIKNIPNIIEHRKLSSFNSVDEVETLDSTDLNIEYLPEYCNICRQKIENSELLEQELSEVCK